MEQGWCKAATSTYFLPTRKLETSNMKKETASEQKKLTVDPENTKVQEQAEETSQRAAEGGA